MRLLVDTDAANEIDDLYAVALALASPDRFRIEGFVATHFAASAGPDSTERSYALLLEELELAGMAERFAVRRGGHPMCYHATPSESEGVDLIIERARSGSAEDPLWVVCLGAATNLASALILAPDIAPRVRYVFHARSEMTWPERSVQFNVRGDINAARHLLSSDVPLVWFDTGTHVCAPMETTSQRLAPSGRLGRFLHDFRLRDEHFQRPDKGFFDLADIAWLVDPSLATADVVPAPTMDFAMFFDHSATHGHMLRVRDIAAERTWELFFRRMAAGHVDRRDTA
jgi:inosine-uridine nucleoside N-ribohydrolase